MFTYFKDDSQKSVYAYSQLNDNEYGWCRTYASSESNGSSSCASGSNVVISTVAVGPPVSSALIIMSEPASKMYEIHRHQERKGVSRASVGHPHPGTLLGCEKMVNFAVV